MIESIIALFYNNIGFAILFISLCVLLIFSSTTIFILIVALTYLIPETYIFTFFEKISRCMNYVFFEEINKIKSNIKETFKISILHTIPKRSIRIWHPHGISGLTPVIHNGYNITNSNYKPSKGVAHSIFFNIPLLRVFIKYMNAIPSDYKTIKETVTNESISITIGGVDEMSRTNDKNLELVIRRRKGIFKIALETGTPIVPILTYGDTEMFPETDIELFKWINSKLYEYFSCRIPFPTIVSLYNWFKITKEPLEPIHTYTGRPIYVKKIENPTDKHIQSLRKIYISRIIELFDETNSGDFSLKIV